MDLASIKALLNQPKSALAWSGWSERPNHAGMLINVSALMDAAGVAIPRLTVECQVKTASRIGSCFYLFTLMHLEQKQRRRIYQLEVAPHWKRTHNGLTVIYGPHEHLETEPSPLSDPVVNCSSWAGCARWFFARTMIAPGSIEDPVTP